MPEKRKKQAAAKRNKQVYKASPMFDVAVETLVRRPFSIE